MSRVDFKDLKISKQYRPKLNPYYYDDLIAYDTETYQGRAVLICDSKGNYIYPTCIEDCLGFLTRRKYRSILGWFYNINYDVEAILKWLPEEEIRELAKFGEIMDYANIIDKVKIKLIDRKMLILNRAKHTFNFYDIGNFYKGGLDANAKKYLATSKKHNDIDFENATLDFMRSEKVRARCLDDAMLTEKLAQNFIDTCNGFRMFTSNFCSPASIAAHHFISNCNIPTLKQCAPRSKLSVKIAYEAYKGGFISTFKKGYFEKVHLYDLKSAYPYWITKLPDMTKGRLILSPKKIPKSAFMGWMRVNIRTPNKGIYNPAYFSPVATFIKRFNKNYYFGGSFSATITLLEYHVLKHDFDIEVKEGYYWIPNKLEFIYKDEVNRIYALKEQSRKDKNLYSLLKTILNGFYGKLIQKIPKKESTEYEAVTGNLFNPFHASYVTAGPRMQVYEFIKQHGPQNLVGVMTDGIAFSKDCKIGSSNELGQWSVDMVGEGVFIGSGLYSIREGDKIKTATRGFQLTEKVDFFKLLASNLDFDKIEFPQKVRLTYREALRVKQFCDWNILKEGFKNININCDTKRIWSRDFKNCRDVLENTIDSLPIFVKQV